MNTAAAAPGGLQVDAVTIAYGRHRAVSDVSVDFRPRRLHALLGANGSGKSTLIKALAGVVPIRSGRVRVAGGPWRTSMDSDEARRGGLRFVHQDLGLVPELSVLDNYFLGGPPVPTGPAGIRWPTARSMARDALGTVGTDPPLRRSAGELGTRDQVLLAVARAWSTLPSGAGLLFLDEPTARLDEREAQRLLESLRRLADDSGAGVVIVTHRLREVFQHCDEVTVLRDGVVRLRGDVGSLTLAGVRSALTRSQDRAAGPSGPGDPTPRSEAATRAGTSPTPTPADAPTPLSATSATGHTAGGPPADTFLEFRAVHGGAVRDLSLRVGRGEVLGLTGLEGSGKEEVAALLTGRTRPRRGEILLDGRPFRPRDSRAAVQLGVAPVPADRRGLGGIALMTVGDNLLLPRLRSFSRHRVFRTRTARAAATEALGRYDVHPQEPDRPFGTLSGGNQQKVVIARWLSAEPRLLVLHEPTAGVDEASRTELHGQVRRAAGAGLTVVVVSSDPVEISQVCDRAGVLVDGRLVALVGPGQLTPERLLALSFDQTEGRTHVD